MFELGLFTVSHPIGQGGMGDVWAGRHEPTGLPVAVKFLDGAMAKEHKYQAIFRREVEAMAALDHPAILTVHDYGIADSALERSANGSVSEGTPWLILEFASDGGLDTHPLPGSWAEVRQTLLVMLDALAHAHARGVIHRDLKPANVLRCGEKDLRPGLKLADFGIAHTLGGSPVIAAKAGTPRFMAPEQVHARWRDFGPWTDLYALGITTWLWVTGRPPFRGWFQDVRRMHLQDDPPPLKPRFAVPSGLEQWLRKLLEKDPCDRPRNAAHAAHLLLGLGEVQVPAGKTPQPTSVEHLTLFTLVPWEEDEEAPSDTIATGVPARSAVQLPSPSDWRVPEPVRPPGGVAGAGLGLLGLRTVPFVGRHSERDALWKLLCQVIRQRRVAVAAISGPHGVGKTRLGQWLCRRAAEVGIAGGWVATHAFEGGPGHGLDGLFARIHRPTPGDGTVADLRQALLEASREGPLVLLLDDIHWSETSLKLASALARDAALTEAPLLVVFTAEPDADGTVKQGLEVLFEVDGVCRFDLDPLPDSDIAELVDQLLGLDRALAARVVDRSAGSPLYATQLIADWGQRELLERRTTGFTLRAGAEAELPADLGLVWSQRLDRLLDPWSPAGRHSLMLAALLGVHVDAEEWRVCCEEASLPVAVDLLSEFSRGGFLVPDPDGDSHVWRQGLMREALLHRARSEGEYAWLNHACARALAAAAGPRHRERMGLHLVAAGGFADAIAPLLDAAADRSAINEYGRAIWLLSEVASCLERSDALPDDPRWAEVGALRLKCRYNLWEMERALVEGELVSARCRANGWTQRLAEVLGVMGQCAFRLKRLADSRRYFENALDQGPEARAHRQILRGLGQVAQLEGRLEDSQRYYEAYGAVAEEHGDALMLASSYNDRGNIAVRSEDYAKAESLFRAGLAIAEDGGYRDASVARINVAFCQFRRGEVSATHAMATKTAEEAAQRASLFVQGVAWAMLLCTCVSVSDWEQFDSISPRVRPLLRHTGAADLRLAVALEQAGQAAIDTGHPDRARLLWAVCIDQLETLGRETDRQRLLERSSKI